MKKVVIIVIIILSKLFITHALAQGFERTAILNPVAAVKNTGDKPQSKVWTYDGKWWTVFPTSSGTFIWRLDGTSWTSVLKISSSQTVRADCKVVANVCHIFLWRKEEYPSQLISVEYVPSSANYKLWSQRPATAYINQDAGVEIGTIDIDGNGRMWLASDALTDINIRWSDPPYSIWSEPITLASGVTTDDIGAVIAMPAQRQIGVLWSNQNAKRFGFKTHNDGSDPALWSTDEVPASQSALNVRSGMSDDHINMAIAPDGTLYCAVKTGYDTPGYPTIALLKRHTNGIWDDLYEVSQSGTRPIVILNEATNKLKVIYSSNDRGGDLLYKESGIGNISFGDSRLLLGGGYDNPTSTKNNYTSDIVILAADTISTSSPYIVGVLATDPAVITVPSVPVLLSPVNLASEVIVHTALSWNESMNASSYHIQVSTTANFSSIIFEQNNISLTSVEPEGLTTNTTYYWRVEGINTVGTSGWSAVWSFITISQPPETPLLISPTNGSINILTSLTLEWGTTLRAASYQVQVSSSSEFSTMIINQGDVTDTTLPISGLLDNTLYYWRVLATNAAGNSPWSTTWNFTTQQNIPNSLIGGWKMDEGNGASLIDISTFGNNAVTTGSPIWVPGVYGMALKLNGTNQFATVPDAPSLGATNGITIAAWIKPEKKASQYIIQKGETVDGYQLYLLSTGKVSFEFNQITNSSNKINSKTQYPYDGITWIHVAATFNGAVARIYIDGVLDKSVTFPIPALINKNNLPISLGAKNDGKSLLNGCLDDVRIYNYALTSAEIASLMVGAETSIDARVTSTKESVGIEDQPDANRLISVYPNPVQDILILNLPSFNDEEVLIRLSDPQGNTRLNTKAWLKDNSTEIDLSNLNLHAGLYFITVRTISSINTIRLIKL